MREFEVAIETRVREVYMVSAVDRQNALDTWSDGVLVQSECQEVLEVVSVTEVTEAW